MALEKVSFKGWENVYKLANGTVELLITADVGPRIIRFALGDGPNMFKEYGHMIGQTGGDEWKIYGGHRLWHAPEDPVRTYVPDNSPVDVTEHNGGLRVIQPVEELTGIQKQMDIVLAGNGAVIHHTLTNKGQTSVELAVWALTVMAPGGQLVFPLPPKGTHPQAMLPNGKLSLWPYTRLSDPRWTFGDKYIWLQQDEAATTPQKIGAWVPQGWAAYAHHGNLFVKRFPADEKETYPDFGVNFETFTNEDMLEVESVGEVAILEPGQSVSHQEQWFLLADTPLPQTDDAVDDELLPKLNALIS